MTGRLLLWNLLLVACASAGIYELRRQWIETRAQQEAVLKRKAQTPDTPAAAEPARPEPFKATSYAAVVEQTLFSKDRNPNIVIEPPPAQPVVVPPPPPQMPPLPKLYGVLGLPSGFVALMAERSGGDQHKVRVGDKIGEFSVTKLDSHHIAMQWNDKTIEKDTDDLMDLAPAPVAVTATVASNGGGAPPPPPPTVSTRQGPGGIDIGDGVRACIPNDPSADGAVVDGWTKSVSATPFGNACRWIQNKK